MKNNGLPWVLLLGTLFGSSLISSRFGLTEFPSLTFVGLRMAVSTLCFTLAFTFTRRYSWPTNRSVWRHGIVMGIVGTTIPMNAFIAALNYISGGVAAIVGAAGPAFTVLLAHFLLKDERMNWQKGLGVALALSGAIVLSLRGESGLTSGGELAYIGYLLVIGSNISSSFGIIYARTFLKDANTFQITSVRVLTAGLITLPIAWFVSGIDFSEVTRVGIISLFYSSIISSFLGFILSLYIVTRFGVATSIMTNYIVPVVAAIGGVIILNEQVTVGMLGGMTIIIAGVYLINQRQPPPMRMSGGATSR